MCLTVVSETTSLPPLVRSSEMPLPVNPSILLFSMTTEVPARLLPRMRTPLIPLPAPLMSSADEPHGPPDIGRIGDVDVTPVTREARIEPYPAPFVPLMVIDLVMVTAP